MVGELRLAEPRGRGDLCKSDTDISLAVGHICEALEGFKSMQEQTLTRAEAAEARLTVLREGLANLLQFRWNDRGYGQLTCRSCGALASMDNDEDGGHFRRIDKCSKSCPWQVAETLIAGLEEPGI